MNSISPGRAPGAGAYRAVGVLLAVVSILAFSIRPVFIKLAYSYVTDPITLLALQVLIGLARTPRPSVPWRDDPDRTPPA